MDKLALLAVGVFMIVGIHINVNSQSNLVESESRLAESEYEVLARNAAIAGLNRARQLLSDDFKEYLNVTGSNEGISFSVNASVSGNLAIVHSQATITSAEGKQVPYNVKAKFYRKTILPPEAPPFMRYAVISDDDLILRGSIDGDIYVDGNSDNTLNANMHSNKKLGINGNAAYVKGFGTFVETADPSIASLLDNFVPNHNPSSANHVYRTAPIYIPPMVPGTLAASTTVDRVTIGDLTLSGTYDLGGTPDDPYIWRVTGNVTIANGGTQVNGYTMFLIDGNADLRANVKVGGAASDRPDESTTAFYTGGGVRLRGGAEVWGQIYANGGIVFESGNPSVYGSVTTKGGVDFRGAVDIFYRKASPVLTTPFQAPLFKVEQTAYSEW